MAYLIVVVMSLLVGGAVYAATLRSGSRGPVAAGFEGLDAGAGDPDAGGAEGPGPGYAYLRVTTRGPSWRDRLQGFVGLIVLVAAGAAALAFGVYQLGHLLNLTIERFLEK
jgi:hypothetical protein